MLTGTDIAALRAVVEILSLYQLSGKAPLMIAFSLAVIAMQRKCRQFAYHAIAQVGNWEERAEYWSQAKLWENCDFTPDTAWLCRHEPGGPK